VTALQRAERVPLKAAVRARRTYDRLYPLIRIGQHAGFYTFTSHLLHNRRER